MMNQLELNIISNEKINDRRSIGHGKSGQFGTEL